jgi:hypothetical protein
MENGAFNNDLRWNNHRISNTTFPRWLEWRGTNQIWCDNKSKKSRDEQICGKQGKVGEEE